MADRLTVMLADDNPDDRALVARALTRTFDHLEIVEVRNPRDLQRIVEEKHVDVAVLDYALGWTTGIEILDRVRDRWPNCATVMFTDTGSEEVAVRALKRGLDDYLVKSSERLEVLTAAIQRALETREQRKEIARLEAALRGLFDRLPGAIYRTTPDGQLLYANPALLDLLGFESLEELSESPITSLYVDPREREVWFGDAREEGDFVDRETRLRRRDGEVIWVHDRGRVVRLGEDGPVVFEGLLDDITARKRAEEGLKRQASFLELLQFVTAAANEAPKLADALRTALQEVCERLEWRVGHVYLPSEDDREGLVPAPIWYVDDEDRFEAFVEATREIRFPVGEGLPGRVYDRGRPEWMESLTDTRHFARSAAAREVGLVSALAVPVTSGREIAAILEFYSDERRPEDPELLNVLFQAGIQLGRIAERERAERERERMANRTLQAQKMSAVGRLASGVAHDFNNLLTVIMLEAEGALVQASSDEVRNAIEEIRGAGDRAGALVRQLLTFSRQDEPGTTTVFDLNDVVEASLRMLERLLGEDVRLESDLADELRPVRATPGDFEQVLVNLVVNASDAMPEGGTIAIETRNVDLAEHPSGAAGWAGRGVLLAVSDTGVGISESMQERVFEPFFTTKEEGRGTGLGLATAYGIVHRAGGVLRVYSEVGEGSTFKVFLPAADEGAATESVEGYELPTGSETILLVEDEEEVRNVTGRALRGQGFRVLEADGGESALEVLRERGSEVDLLLTDVGMPGIRGPELAKRALERFPELPVLLTSGYGRQVVESADPEGLRDLELVPKPYSVLDLIRRVRSVLDGAKDEGAVEE